MDTENQSKLREMMNVAEDQADAIGVSIEQVQEQIDEFTDQADAIDEALMDDAADKLAAYLYGKAVEYQYPALTFQGLWEEGQSYAVDDNVSVPNGSTGDQYVCIQAHTSSEDNEPGVGPNWTSYWDVAGALTTIRVVLGAGYNLTEINDWAIQEFQTIFIPNPTPPPPTIPSSSWVTIYEYLGVGWDGDTQIVEWQDDWDFGCDYLHHPLGVEADGDNSPDCVLRVASGVKASYGLYPRIDSLNSAKTILTNNQTKVTDSEAVFDRYLEE